MDQAAQKRDEQEDEWGCRMGGEEGTHSGVREDLLGGELSVGPEGDRRSQTQQDGEMEAVLVDNGEAERGDGAEVDKQTGEEELQRELEVCLWPVERSGALVRISLEEVQRYYRFSRCCHWLCGRFDIISCSH